MRIVLLKNKIIYKLKYWFRKIIHPSITFKYDVISKTEDIIIKVNNHTVVNNTIAVAPYQTNSIEIIVPSNYTLGLVELYENYRNIGYVYIHKVYQLFTSNEVKDVYVIDYFIFRSDITFVLTLIEKENLNGKLKSN